MGRYILSLVSRWLFPATIDVEKRLASMSDRNHELERLMARRVRTQVAQLRISSRQGSLFAGGTDTRVV